MQISDQLSPAVNAASLPPAPAQMLFDLSIDGPVKDRLRKDLNSEYAPFWRHLTPAARPYLADLIKFGSDGAFALYDFDKAIVAYREKKSLNHLGIAKCNTAVKYFNQSLTGAYSTLTAVPRIPNKRDDRLVENGALSASLRAEIDAFCALLATTPKSSTSDPAGAPQLRSKETIVRVRDRLRRCARICKRFGVDANSFEEIAVLAVLKTFCRQKEFADFETPDTSRNLILMDIGRLLIALDKSAEAIAMVESFIAIQAKKKLDIPEHKFKTLQLFDDPALFEALYRECERVVDAFVEEQSRRTLSRAQAALGVLIILSTACKRDELMSVAFVGGVRHINPSTVCKGGALMSVAFLDAIAHKDLIARPALQITLDGAIEDLESLLPDEVSTIADRYWIAANCFLEPDPELLFEDRCGEKKSGANASTMIKRVCSRLFVEGVGSVRKPLLMTPGTLRDLVAKMLMEADENSTVYEKIRSAFGYSLTDNFRLRYRGFRKRLAAEKVLAAKKRNKQEEE